jgi:hypothetical protein
MVHTQTNTPEAVQARLKAEATQLRDDWDTGKYWDRLESNLPGLKVTRRLAHARFYEHLLSLDALLPGEMDILRNARLDAFHEADRLISARLAEVAELAARLADAFGESLSHSLATSGRLKTLLDRYEADRQSYEDDYSLIHEILVQLVGQDKYEEANEKARNKELSDEKNH